MVQMKNASFPVSEFIFIQNSSSSAFGVCNRLHNKQKGPNIQIGFLFRFYNERKRYQSKKVVILNQFCPSKTFCFVSSEWRDCINGGIVRLWEKERSDGQSKVGWSDRSSRKSQDIIKKWKVDLLFSDAITSDTCWWGNAVEFGACHSQEVFALFIRIIQCE